MDNVSKVQRSLDIYQALTDPSLMRFSGDGLFSLMVGNVSRLEALGVLRDLKIINEMAQSGEQSSNTG